MSTTIDYNNKTVEIISPTILQNYTKNSSNTVNIVLRQWFAENDEFLNEQFTNSAMSGLNYDYLIIPQTLKGEIVINTEPLTLETVEISLPFEQELLIDLLQNLTDTSEGGGEKIFEGYTFGTVEAIDSEFKIEISWSESEGV